MSFTQNVDPEKIHINRCFSTPLASLIYPEADLLNLKLLDAIETRRNEETGALHSNDGGWQSSADFPAWAGDAGEAILAFAMDFATQLTAAHSEDHGLIEPDFEWRHNAWVNVNEAGHGNALHGHPGAFWSGVYWVDDGGRHDDVSIGGDLEFPDPRGMMPSVYNPTLRMRIDGCLTAGYSTTITPCTGTLVMFPSWLMHLVQSYKGKRPRVSIAFNFGV
ncbi:putative 2OG-Fe(II) oxygenase [Pseudomonas syringae]|uniref:putative 2OG-Fe(II) oxygenase n=1 Tax=Pseudomonas syringae TaxID=317 RepID=UPI0020BE25FB|nr:putative 2OG-Fe(II) oxygenase [Pseudomonas syringae]MCL6310106.1 2OG-Fe(II) oxygenase family protein [Pseudomonas syringae]